MNDEIKQKVYRFIYSKFRIDEKQKELLFSLPTSWFVKCEKVIRICESKDYRLELKIDGLVNYDPKPDIYITHEYIVNRNTKSYKHTLSFIIDV